MNGTTGKIVKYSVFPGFVPRLFALATSGFATLAYYIASVYNIVKLLPDDHLYLQRQNIGKYGVRHVIIAAAANLEFRRQNIDQIIIFFTILTGLILIAIQIVLFGLALFASQEVLALTFPVADLFNNPNGTTGSLGPTQDIAFIILDRVFGLEGIYNSCVAVGVACEDSSGLPSTATIPAYPYPFHRALHVMLQFYSLGIVVVAAMLFVYFTITIVGETAVTGTPFGQRFNRAWAPVRIILFFAMILPLNIGGTNAGLNGAQIVTFWVAKHGSNFATNAWAFFNTELVAGTYLGPQQNIIAEPTRPEMGDLNQFILTAKTCQYVERRFPTSKDIIPYIVRSTPPNYVDAPLPGTVHPDAREFLNTDYATALEFSLQGNIYIRFGELSTDANNDGTIDDYEGWGGNVFPYCGQMAIITTDVFEPGSIYIAEEYYRLVQNLWTDPMINQVAQCIVNDELPSLNIDPLCEDSIEPDSDYVQAMQNYFNDYVDAAIENGINQQRLNGNFLVPPELIEKGWAGAAIWFNRIAEMNGATINAAMNVPRSDKYPWMMILTHEERISQNENVFGANKYSPVLSGDEPLRLEGGRESVYPAVHRAYTFWHQNNTRATTQTQSTGNIVLDTINLILGTSGIFDIRENVDINPLAQLTAIGKGMMEATVRNTAIAGAGSIASIIGGVPAEVAKPISGFMWSMISVSIGIAVILYYVLPFLPFIYFLFAVSGWVKSIFEAIVAMPLWALAHIRIDGEGIPGQDASNGYFLLLEIFLRPILILFGLLASISIFSALVVVLNSVFNLMVNVGGFDLEGDLNDGLPTQLAFYRGPIDEFFFTAMYAIICYLIGISCFKLVDLIPNNILRWIGANAATFQENAGDPAGQLTNNVYRGSVLVTNQVKGATQGNLPAILAG